jgi:hypothetical protein
VAVSPDGASAYITNFNADSVSQYDIAARGGGLSPKSPPTVPAGSGPEGIAVRAGPRLPTQFGQCTRGGWRTFGFKSLGHCLAFVALTRVCAVLERQGITPGFCPPRPPRP